jgi:hypothetical protein
MLHKVNAVSSAKKSRKAQVVIGFLLVAFIFTGLELTNTTHFFGARAVSGTIPSLPNKDGKKSSGGGSAPVYTAPVGEKAAASDSPTSEATLITPYGTFVSNHKPSLSGNSAPSSEVSVCITTPGASCTIVFTKEGVTKQLEAKTADSSGSVYWEWDVKEAGFIEGKWTIEAKASSAGQNKTATDDLGLEVRS